MILLWLVIIPLAAGPAAWLAGRWRPLLSRWIALLALAGGGLLALSLWPRVAELHAAGDWLAVFDSPWMPALGVGLRFGLDGLSLVLVLLTYLLGLVAVGASWTEVRHRVGLFHLNLLLVVAGIVGVFTALDLVLFYLFWELMLVPMYFLIAVWGHADRRRAAMKFFLFTQAGGLLLLIAIVALGVAHLSATGRLSFDYLALLRVQLPAGTQLVLMLGFFAAFAVKLPAVPLHTWLPDAHTEAPTGGSVILAGLLLKTGAYGLLRLGVPLFPAAAVQMAPVAMTLGVIGILYGAVTALGQTDVKRLVAYTSVSHLGFALLGIYAWNGLALQGVVMELVCHGLSTGGLFVVAGLLQERLHTRDMDRMGGLWRRFPRAGGLAMILALASLGLPGLGNFVGEILILLGAYQANPGLAAVATLGLVVAAAYALAMIQRVFHGPPSASGGVTRDLVPREALVLGLAVTLLLWLGFYPGPVLEMVEPSMDHLRGVSQVTSGLASAAWGAP